MAGSGGLYAMKKIQQQLLQNTLFTKGGLPR